MMRQWKRQKKSKFLSGVNEVLYDLRMFIQHERKSNIPAAIAFGFLLFLIILLIILIPMMVSAVGWEGALFPLGILSLVVLSKHKFRIAIKRLIMNISTQRIIFIVVFVGIVIMVIMGLWPPWKEKYSMGLTGINIHSENPIGYYFIFKPPHKNIRYSYTIDLSRLLIQWFIVILIIGFIVWALSWFKRE